MVRTIPLEYREAGHLSSSRRGSNSMLRVGWKSDLQIIPLKSWQSRKHFYGWMLTLLAGQPSFGRTPFMLSKVATAIAKSGGPMVGNVSTPIREFENGRYRMKPCGGVWIACSFVIRTWR
ncbi:hypothetical protein AGR3A_Lc130350 [Agrobacterium tomkonis CFBP 6623]|uniref:Uncharacterized protein n=1 Tax=Agrobacterium tomkonis CFBP 6623 TaxID=1183432 RepID=A0A1S7REI0_9HYPH|nr:hypothetical protein AGR3A_Lc130350 [Agrobacterium tomkonis CFBP 6623]